MLARSFAMLVGVLLTADSARAGVILAIEPQGTTFTPGQPFTFEVTLTNTGPGTVPLEGFNFQVQITSESGAAPGPGTFDLAGPFGADGRPGTPDYIYAAVPQAFTLFTVARNEPNPGVLAADVGDFNASFDPDPNNPDPFTQFGPADLAENVRYLLYRGTIVTNPGLTGGLRLAFDPTSVTFAADLSQNLVFVGLGNDDNGINGPNAPFGGVTPVQPADAIAGASNVPEPGVIAVLVGLAGVAALRRRRVA